MGESSFTQQAEITGYYYQDFLRRLEECDPLPRPTRYVAQCELLHGQALPRELRDILTLADQRTLPFFGFSEWDLQLVDEARLPDGSANRFEQLVLAAQRERQTLGLLQFFVSCVRIGQSANGDVYVAHIDDENLESAPVLLLDHESGDLVDYVADSLSSFVYLNNLHTLFRAAHAIGEADDGPSYAAVRAGLARLDGRTTLLPPFGELGVWLGDAELGGRFNRMSSALRFRDRSAWILELLAGEPFSRDSFRRVDQRAFDFQRALGGPNVRKYPPTALYWLWRSFLLQEHAQVAQLVAATADSPSPLIRDAASLIAELERGRKQLGAIRDVQLLCAVATEGAAFR